MQDALERTLLAWNRLESRDDPEGYVRRIMVNRNISIWRKFGREHPTDQVYDAGTEDAHFDNDLWQALKSLPTKQRAVIALRYYEDMSEADIARTLGCSVGTVKSQASKALAKLRLLVPSQTGGARMTPDDEDLESRLRGTRSRHRGPTDRIDAEDFLSGVHHGAKVRRTKRTVSVAAAAVLAVAGAGLALNTTGILNGSPAPVATSPSEATDPRDRRAQHAAHPTGPSSPAGTSANESPTPTKGSDSPAAGRSRSAPHGPISAADVHAVSLTATGNDHQWVLAKTPGGQGCSTSSCATLFVTADHGTQWTDVGQLPAPPASSDATTPTSVSQVRFAKRNDTTYDGWAYGNALWSTHDSGQTWSAAESPAGQVTQLEAWGDYVYAGVTSPAPGAHSATAVPITDGDGRLDAGPGG